MRYRFEAVPGKEHTFIVIDKETEEQVNICDKIAEQFDAGKCADKKISGYTK